METLETINYKGYEIKIHTDEDATDPRTFDNLGTMICFHSRYNLGDKHNFSNPTEFLCSLLDLDYYENSISELLEKANKQNIILPLYLYDHSGITMSTNRNYPFNCRWDSMQVGLLYISHEKIREEYLCKRISKKVLRRAEMQLEFEVEEYDNYLTGEVYGYEICKNDNLIDSCWGYYGEDGKDSMIQQCKETILNTLENIEVSKTPEKIQEDYINIMENALAVLPT